VESFIPSRFIRIREPDGEMFRLALDIHQAPPERIVYIDNTPMFVRIAEGPGIRSILHADCESTRDKPAFLGLKIIK
jgi:putative hydrolase of the HAD superfamily